MSITGTFEHLKWGNGVGVRIYMCDFLTKVCLMLSSQSLFILFTQNRSY